MSNYVNYKEYTSTTKCSVDGCENLAEYEVALYDEYPTSKTVFFEQDRTCPFICQQHHDINEAEAVGERVPRAIVKYPYTNKHRAQGYTKYIPVKEAIVG